MTIEISNITSNEFEKYADLFGIHSEGQFSKVRHHHVQHRL